MLRNQGDELTEAIELTPFSREELIRACAMEKNLLKVERVRRFYIRARQTRTGLAQRSPELLTVPLSVYVKIYPGFSSLGDKIIYECGARYKHEFCVIKAWLGFLIHQRVSYST